MSGESVTESWGYCCPRCGSDESIDVIAQIGTRLLPNNETCIHEARDQSWEWDNQSMASCACEYSGTLHTFLVET